MWKLSAIAVIAVIPLKTKGQGRHGVAGRLNPEQEGGPGDE